MNKSQEYVRTFKTFKGIDNGNFSYAVRIRNPRINEILPPEFKSMDEYRATLGHKVNHSFRKNATMDTVMNNSTKQQEFRQNSHIINVNRLGQKT